MVRYKYDWAKIKRDFMVSDHLHVSPFLREQGLPPRGKSGSVDKAVAGWAEEKAKLRKQAMSKAVKDSYRREFQDVEEVREKQARVSRFMQVKGVKEMSGLSSKTVDEARKLVVSGMTQERLALGVDQPSGGRSQQLTQVNVNLPQTRYDEMIKGMNYEQLIRFLAEVKRARVGHTVPEDSSGS